MLKENDIDLCFTCLEMTDKNYEASSDPESLDSDVLREDQRNGLEFERENALECYDWNSYNQILKWKFRGLTTFTFLRMTEKLMENKKMWLDFRIFTNKMHYYQADDENNDNKKINEKCKKFIKYETDEKENSICWM